MPDPRRKSLRELITKLERLPESERRTWMLAETRARVADIETGSSTAPMRPFDRGIPDAASALPPTRGPRPRAHERRVAPVAPVAAAPRLRRTPAPATPTPTPRLPTALGTPQDTSPRTLGDEDVLSLDDPESELPPGTSWRRGLRGES
jgi:hypothetical protein